MHESKVKEDISISYISAICAHAGIAYEILRHDDDSTDGLLKKCIEINDGKKFYSELRIQLKATSSPSQYEDKGDYINYKLKVKNYNDLCCPATTPIILGLLILPEDYSEWVHWTQEDLLIKGCMYWASFSEKQMSDNSNWVSVKLDKRMFLIVRAFCAFWIKLQRRGGMIYSVDF